MRVELTGDIFQGRCEVRTEFCRARVSGSVAVVTSPLGQRITVRGACLEEMADTGKWELPGARPLPDLPSRESEAAVARA